MLGILMFQGLLTHWKSSIGFESSAYRAITENLVGTRANLVSLHGNQVLVGETRRNPNNFNDFRGIRQCCLTTALRLDGNLECVHGNPVGLHGNQFMLTNGCAKYAYSPWVH